MMRRSELALVILLSLPFGVRSTRADSPGVTVWLNDGATVHGELVERVPSSHLTVKLATGEIRKIPWEDIERDSLGEKDKPKPNPAPEPSPTSSSEDDPGTTLTIVGAKGARLERLTGHVEGVGYSGGHAVAVAGNVWQIACTAPCDRAVPPAENRISGDGITPSSTFTLGPDDSRLEVKPGSAGAHTAGYVLSGAGAVSFGIGGLLYLLMSSDKSEAGRVASTMNLALMGTGAVMLAVGLPLWLANRTTVEVKQGSGIALTPAGLSF